MRTSIEAARQDGAVSAGRSAQQAPRETHQHRCRQARRRCMRKTRARARKTNTCNMRTRARKQANASASSSPDTRVHVVVGAEDEALQPDPLIMSSKIVVVGQQVRRNPVHEPDEDRLVGFAGHRVDLSPERLVSRGLYRDGSERHPVREELRWRRRRPGRAHREAALRGHVFCRQIREATQLRMRVPGACSATLQAATPPPPPSAVGTWSPSTSVM